MAQDLRRGCAARLFLGTIADDPISFRDVSFHPDPILRLARLSQIESKLHSHQMFHLRPERLLGLAAAIFRSQTTIDEFPVIRVLFS